jgi:hypothetical protein
MYLPDVQEEETNSYRALGYSDHYGALRIAARYCGMEEPVKPFNAVWMHGCIGPWHNFDPGGLGIAADSPKSLRILVARNDQEVLLRSYGFQRVKTIGLPIIYTPEQPVERISGSLLVMPVHTIRGVSVVDSSVFDRYAEYVLSYREHFERVVACLHHDCVENGYWVNSFKSRGIEVVLGAGTKDRNALIRMRCLFEQFDVVTTNGWGSHVAYALYFGAKVAICGPEVRVCEDDMIRKDGTWRRNQDAFQKLSSREVADAQHKALQHLFREPNGPVEDREFGAFLVGHANMLDPGQMREDFGWTKKDLLLHKILSASGLPVVGNAIRKWAKKIDRRLHHH